MSFYGLNSTVGSLVTSTLMVSRPGATTFDVNGRPASAVPVVFAITACHYPASPRELLRLPEGERGGARLVVWTTDIIRERDVVEADAAEWQVESVEFWAAINTYRAVARRVEP